jgi:outer membrane cobalamin receptor
VTLPSYVKLDLSGSATVLRSGGSDVALTGRVDNLLDRRYGDVFNFPAPRRALFVGIRFSARQ